MEVVMEVVKEVVMEVVMLWPSKDCGIFMSLGKNKCYRDLFIICVLS